MQWVSIVTLPLHHVTYSSLAKIMAIVPITITLCITIFAYVHQVSMALNARSIIDHVNLTLVRIMVFYLFIILFKSKNELIVI
jgi:hypothetical protein